MFRGLSKLNINASGRIAIPTKFRDEIASDEYKGQMILTASHSSRCLVLYPMTKWLDTEQTILRLPNLSKTVQTMKRLVLGYATDAEMDGQGRIMIPAPLREHAGIDKKVAFVGQGEVFELWNENAWDVECARGVDEMLGNLEQDEKLSQLSI